MATTSEPMVSLQKPLVLFCLLVFSFSRTHAELDKNANSQSDIWELHFNAFNLTPGLDADNDGYSNLQEATSGTDPFDPTSLPQLKIEADGSSIHTFWSTLPGKRYRIDTSETLLPNSWQPLLTITGTGEETELPLDLADPRHFYRLSVSNLDSDADGLSDWEELTLGLNPFSSRSDRLDTTDFQQINTNWNTPSTVTIGVLDQSMREDWPNNGLIAIRRSGGIQPLTVFFTIDGSAARGSDYTTLPTNQITIPLNTREVWIEFIPVPDTDPEATETITFTLQPGTGYTLGAATSTTLNLHDTSTQPSPQAAARFLLQAAFGPDSAPVGPDTIPPNVQDVITRGFSGWITHQFDRPIGYLQPYVDWAVTGNAANSAGLYGNYKQFAWWHRTMGSNAIPSISFAAQDPDPLRQRIAFALSQILVVSDRPERLIVQHQGMANYYDLMVKHAFGNYRDLLYDVATHPAMGIFLSHLGNRKANPVNRIYPDENFAREIMQLFTIGLWQLNPDGTRQLDPEGQPIPTYDNGDITELARVFTGLSFGDSNVFNAYSDVFTMPMKMWDAEHDCDPKLLLGTHPLPARTPSPGNTGTAGLADVNAAIDHLFNHPNVGPFIGKQLIQRLVTSNPSPAYINRVSAAFADNGSGIRGDMKAVIEAILLDPEARDPAKMSDPTWGKLREPFLRVVNFARAFNARSTSGHYPLDQFTTDHLQDPMNAPSVFNFFLPNHSPPGPITEQNLVAPEFQIINASTAITGPNYFWNAINGSLHRFGNGTAAYNVRLQSDTELGMVVNPAVINQDTPSAANALDPDPLLRRLDLALTGGTLSPHQFQIIREAMLRIGTGTWQWHRQRLRLAIYLIVTSTDFNVQR
ncbi:DUF1800 family protein [Phragmitibacter flavus]|uniref:DUF1800 family protein n=1 Tax=Phragmitibacter flavus TaxID=2576071 RepID=A0A5R8KAF8_9BACT|nr:DUF1800 family protein [Phragmitibacter flavus]TLD69298.1 DUF1800 family protein [Phragmitibacter flavus]